MSAESDELAPHADQRRTQVRGESVDGVDVWDTIDRGFVSHRFVKFDAA